MMTKALQKQLKAVFNHEILTLAKELELQMSTKLAESCKSKEPCKGTYNYFSSGITHTILAVGMADFECFHSIEFFIRFPNWLPGFLSVDFTAFDIILFVIVLMDIPKWWSDRQRNHDDQARITDNRTCYMCVCACVRARAHVRARALISLRKQNNEKLPLQEC